MNVADIGGIVAVSRIRKDTENIFKGKIEIKRNSSFNFEKGSDIFFFIMKTKSEKYADFLENKTLKKENSIKFRGEFIKMAKVNVIVFENVISTGKYFFESNIDIQEDVSNNNKKMEKAYKIVNSEEAIQDVKNVVEKIELD